MKPQAITLCLFALFMAGCNKHVDLPMQTDTPATGTTLNIMGAGQSRISNGGQDIVAGLEQALHRKVHFVNCAVGGSYIREWSPSSAHFLACEQAMPNPDAIIFAQGEADAKNDGDYATWAQQFTTIINAWRSLHGTKIPIIFAQLGVQTLDQSDPTHFGGVFAHWTDVQNQQASVYKPRVLMIFTADLPLADGIHPTPDGFKTLGARFGQAMNQLGVE